MPDSVESLERAAAWEGECLDRERREGFITLVCTAALIPTWLLFDVFLEPQLVAGFLVLRAGATAVSLLLILALRRARSLCAVRAVLVVNMAVTGPCIAVMLPLVRHFNPYLFGFSLYFWATGALLSWPLRYPAAIFGWLLATLAAATLASPGIRDSSDLVTAAFYLGSAAVIACGMTYAHGRSVRRAFDANMDLASASRELQARNLELARTLGQLGDAQARLVASEKLSALGRLLAGLSHEINNPLNVLYNNLEPVRAYHGRLLEIAGLASSARAEDVALARERARELNVEFAALDLTDATDIMRGAIARMRQIHQDLRTFIRGDTPEHVLGDLNEGLRATVALLSRRLPPGLKVELALEELPPISFQQGQLNQVWHNLVQNAFDALGEQPGRVAIRSRRDGGVVEVSIADDGPGVAPEHRGRLFEPFFTTKPVGKGTGLGLATSYQIVARHGGTLSLDLEHDPGARFVVRLPITTAEPAARAGAPTPNA